MAHSGPNAMMKFHDLTDLGRARRLRPLAESALEVYDLKLRSLKFIAEDTNIFYKVRTEDGRVYALRVADPYDHSLEQHDMELTWLAHLHAHTDLRLVRPIPNRLGHLITEVEGEGVPDVRYCVLFEWIPGVCLADNRTPQLYADLGTLSARMHTVAEAFTLPKRLRPLKWNRVFYWPGEDNSLFDRAYRKLMPTRRADLFRRVILDSEVVLDKIFQRSGEPILIHGDLHWWNVLVSRGQLSVIDFADVMLGFPLQDVAITLWYGRSADDYPDLVDGFKEGYTRVRPWPLGEDYEIEMLMAARSLMFANSVINTWHLDDAEDYLERAEARLRRFY